ncbi:PAS domain-containing sensor histidine kinase [Desulfobulbus alkaliphilus]|uniref:PAS domain-containing sensor histidine kinase n=1 Tax=Desulfobulbus alkaliphilus TaxID=869814 RepID=UPI0019665E21|nr:ATP-binding protein [Desulfobulbus alkaliphilus]MBM9535655.1 PAS domain S-box protein [Desulfobulbus alkaliphilus]
MTDQQSGDKRLEKLRRLAEQQNKERTSSNVSAAGKQDYQQLVHELQVHQIELEMQNEELRMTQEQLSESLEKYSDLFDFAPVGYVTTNIKGRILEANLTFADQLGMDRGRLINTALSLYAAAPDRAAFSAHLAQVFRSGERHTCEVRLEQRNGSGLYVQADSIRALHDDGSPSCRTSITDISIRKAAEEALIRLHGELENKVFERTIALSASEKEFRKLSQEFRTLLDAISDTLILFSPEIEILWINGDNRLKFNGEILDPAGEYCYKLFHDRQALLEECPVRRCFETGRKEVAMVTYNGAVLDIRAFPVHDTDRVSNVLLLVGDITEKMAMQAEAIQAVHLASLGELAAGVAHEINNPITGIINYGQILINECSPDSLGVDIGARVVKEGERVACIVKNLLSYAQHDRRKDKRSSSIAAILAESIVLTQAQMRKEGITLTVDLPDDLPRVDANFQQIQQCMINIINNARYALNEKYAGRHADKRLDITGESVMIDGCPWVRIVFDDHGVGIAPQALTMLTKPFFSTKPFGKGTGLGLNITQKIITDHGGTLRFESIEGAGARVIMELPVHQNDVEAGV